MLTDGNQIKYAIRPDMGTIAKTIRGIPEGDLVSVSMAINLNLFDEVGVFRSDNDTALAHARPPSGKYALYSQLYSAIRKMSIHS
jgi:hypothetical protein